MSIDVDVLVELYTIMKQYVPQKDRKKNVSVLDKLSSIKKGSMLFSVP